MPTAAKWKKYAGGGGELRALPAPFYALKDKCTALSVRLINIWIYIREQINGFLTWLSAFPWIFFYSCLIATSGS